MPFTTSSAGLLDTLADRMECPCLSDLGSPTLRLRLIRTLSGMPAKDFSLQEWQEAASYLLRIETKFSSAEEARGFLLKRL